MEHEQLIAGIRALSDSGNRLAAALAEKGIAASFRLVADPLSCAGMVFSVDTRSGFHLRQVLLWEEIAGWVDPQAVANVYAVDAFVVITRAEGRTVAAGRTPAEDARRCLGDLPLLKERECSNS